MLGACAYSGLAATAVNNVLLARANRHLGPTVANLYMPLQPLTTVLIDYCTLGDAVYAANVVCGLGVAAGLVLAVAGKHSGGSGGAAGAEAAGEGAEEREGLLSAEGLLQLSEAAGAEADSKGDACWGTLQPPLRSARA
jgi:hypothetical protein